MRDDRIPVLWLYGPAGVGKTVVGWEIFGQLRRAGIAAGYVDIDQLGMCYPEPASDPGRHRMQARNLAAVVTGFRAAGARCVSVSGVVDAARGVPVDQFPRAALTACRLRAGRDELRRRFVGRSGPIDQVPEVLSEADALDARAAADVCVDTSGLPVADVARLVRRRVGGWPVLTRPAPPAAPADLDGPAPTAADGPILWLCGTTGVGKSTVGWAVYQTALRAGRTAAYIDLDQIGFCHPAPAGDPGNHRVKAANLAALWRTYRAAGAQRLVMVGPVHDEAAVRTYTDALPAAAITLCRLHAGRDQLTRRILVRGEGGSWSQPGDPLTGQPTAYLLQIADRAVADADALARAAIGDLCVNTDGRTVDETAEVIVSSWPTRPA